MPASADVRIGKIAIKKSAAGTAKNDRAAQLLVASAFAEGDRWSAELRIPYSVVPGQVQWMNGVEHGRYIVGCNGKSQTVYFLSTSARVRQRLENLALGSIDHWHRVWKRTGIIPSGIGTPTAQAGAWEISDAGNCAHLIKAIAFWLIYTADQREWTIIQQDFAKDPRPAPALPASVLKAQGLE